MKFILLSLLMIGPAFAKNVNVPPRGILNAGRKLIPQNYSYYEVKGKIKCHLLNSGWGPSSSSCVVTINRIQVAVGDVDTDEIIESVMKVEPPRGPFYAFTADFVATSYPAPWSSEEFVESAVVFLEE